MPYNTSTPLWNDTDRKNYFDNLEISPILQEGPHCVSTTLAMLTGVSPRIFQQQINTQNPVSWSDALKPFGLKFAYCPHDIRQLKYYCDELLQLDDLFTLSYYTSRTFLGFNKLLSAPHNKSGWICGSHIIILHKDSIYDPALGRKVPAREHSCWDYYTKRIFRVVPITHHRGL